MQIYSGVGAMLCYIKGRLRNCGALPQANRPSPSVALRHLPTLWGVTLQWLSALDLTKGTQSLWNPIHILNK